MWASEYSHQLNLSWEDMDRIVTEGKELGIHAYVMTGGEPMVRKRDIVRLARKHSDCGFMLFTNGTLVDQQFCDDMRSCKNIVLSMSIEGDEQATDARRGAGTFRKVMDAMDLLRSNGLAYGTSICYTRANCEAVTGDEFLDFLIDKGVAFSWYFHFMPVGMDTTMELVPTVEQRKYMYHRIREIRGFEGGKPIFCMDFQNDGEFVSGCIAGGKYYCHINPNGDVEPCVFIHYSGANIHDMPLLDCLKQPLFRAYQEAQPFNRNLLQPCPMLENPQMLRKMVEEPGGEIDPVVRGALPNRIKAILLLGRFRDRGIMSALRRIILGGADEFMRDLYGKAAWSTDSDCRFQALSYAAMAMKAILAAHPDGAVMEEMRSWSRGALSFKRDGGVDLADRLRKVFSRSDNGHLPEILSTESCPEE